MYYVRNKHFPRRLNKIENIDFTLPETFVVVIFTLVNIERVVRFNICWLSNSCTHADINNVHQRTV